ncbi:FecR domain-containing protein [Rhizobium glycinendophyticum]|uniref:FecR protein domain-containing protein n=1 Tax=Rhizobium glycinendophyticum TaxID=2589807 RepID=A0A504TT20_9HYPH|nr:hypothetical protein FJQ55_22365 [Rhizobium glycinendophyticum]
MRFMILTILCLVMTTFANQLSATDYSWVAAKATRQVAYTTDNENWIPLRTGMAVPDKAWISTGPRGRLELKRGVERIIYQPNTLAAIHTQGDDHARKTEIIQQIGELNLEIERRARPHTTVQTPFLAAVVKGTQFKVTVGTSDSAVSVDRGLVQVTSFSSGERSNLGAGQGARVGASGMKVDGAFNKPTITHVSPSKALVPAVDAMVGAPSIPPGATPP